MNKATNVWTNSARIGYDAYEIIPNDGSVSCIGKFTDKQELASCLLQYAVPKEPITSNVKDSGMVERGEDYGPQRFCRKHDNRLEELYDSSTGELVYRCPICDEILDDDHIYHGGMEHTNMDMDDMRNVYRNLSGTDAQWLKDNSRELKAIYKEYGDDAGEPVEHLPLLYNEDGELITDLDPEVIAGRMEAPLDTDGICKLTRQELYILGYASYVLAYNPYKVRQKLNSTMNVRLELREHINTLVDIFIETEFKHPKMVRRNRRYPKNWKELELSINFDDAWAHQDWETESRKQLNYVYC